MAATGESPVAVVAPTTPTDCFTMAFEACRIAMEHMTPVILLSDAFIGNGILGLACARRE